MKVLHDNLQAKGTPKGSFGIGHTQLAWTRDGENPPGPHRTPAGTTPPQRGAHGAGQFGAGIFD